MKRSYTITAETPCECGGTRLYKKSLKCTRCVTAAKNKVPVKKIKPAESVLSKYLRGKYVLSK